VQASIFVQISTFGWPGGVTPVLEEICLSVVYRNYESPPPLKKHPTLQGEAVYLTVRRRMQIEWKIQLDLSVIAPCPSFCCVVLVAGGAMVAYGAGRRTRELGSKSHEEQL
jgi:hypothetical protein